MTLNLVCHNKWLESKLDNWLHSDKDIFRCVVCRVLEVSDRLWCPWTLMIPELSNNILLSLGEDNHLHRYMDNQVVISVSMSV